MAGLHVRPAGVSKEELRFRLDESDLEVVSSAITEERGTLRLLGRPIKVLGAAELGHVVWQLVKRCREASGDY